MITYKKSDLSSYVELLDGKPHLFNGERHDFFYNEELIEDVSVLITQYGDEQKVRICAENRKAGIRVFSALDGCDAESIKEGITIKVNKWEVESYPKIEELLVSFSRRDLTFCYVYDLDNWLFPFTFRDYDIEFSRIKGSNIFALNYFDKPENQITIEIDCSLKNKNVPLLDKIKSSQDLILKFHNEAIERLSEPPKSLITTFNFPDEIKIHCEQYLLYFAQFLQDLGINVTSDIKEEAGKVLFLVTPTDEIEALDKIREALAVYLNLPSSPVVFDDSFASIRTQREIENLQHAQRMKEMEIHSVRYTLRLAQQTIESQDKLLHQKDLLIEQQNKVLEKILSKSVMIDSAENKEQLEEIFEGFKVGESKFLKEQFGIHLNPAKAIKTIGKKILGKENDNLSILDTNEKVDKGN